MSDAAGSECMALRRSGTIDDWPRSQPWRYWMIFVRPHHEKFVDGPGINDGGSDDNPSTATSGDAMIAYLRATDVARRRHRVD